VKVELEQITPAVWDRRVEEHRERQREAIARGGALARMSATSTLPGQLTFFAEGSHASHGVSPESSSAPTTSATSGLSSRASSTKPARPSSSARTCLGCALVACVSCWPTLPRAGSMSSGRISEQVTLGRRIDANASSSWLPTPSASAYGSNRGGSAGRVGKIRPSLQSMAATDEWPDWLTPTVWDAKPAGPKETEMMRLYESGTNVPDTYKRLRAQVAARELWPTPTVKGNHNKAGLSARSGDGLATAVSRAQGKTWPTPMARDWKRSGGQERRHSPNLPNAVGHGPLNPTWVEWLMGFPAEWTACEPSATPSSRKSRK